MLGIRSFALSQAYNLAGRERVVPWETARRWRRRCSTGCIDTRLAARRPSQHQFPELRRPMTWPALCVTTQGKLTYGLWVEERADGRGFPYYWLRFGREKATDVVEGSDMAALRRPQGLGHAAETRSHRL